MCATASYTMAYSDEAIKEAKEFFRSKKCYVGTDGRFINDTVIDTVKYVLQNMTS